MVSFCIAALSARAQFAHTEARLVLGAETARPGDTVMAGVHLHMETGWHTYWKNSGASGIPTKIEWQLPAGVTAGEIQWPLPEKTPDGELTTYIYRDDVVLLVPLKLAADLKPGALALKAKVSWLECKESCIPGKAEVQATLNVGSEAKSSAAAALMESWKYKLPRADNLFTFSASWEKPASGNTRPLIISGIQMAADILLVENADFFPEASDAFEVQPATEKLPDASGFSLRKVVKNFSGDWPKQIGGVIITEGNNQRNGFEAQITITDPTPSLPAQSLWLMLLYAFIGGLILNVMPCVLPVIALKILGFVGQTRNDKRRLRMLGLIYAAGVLASFLVIAALVIGVKTAGHRVGWGFQFGNPYFLIAMTTLVTLIALNLFGVFEITLGGRAMNAASNLSSGHGAAGAFFNGLLATALATSCSAPILGTAIGFAFAQPPLIISLMLLTVGAGLAAPYVALSWHPAWLKFLPKPGAWMEKFKVAMGFPMLAAGVWFFNLVVTYYEDRTWWLAIFLVFVALASWVFGEFVQRGGKRRGLAWAVIWLLLATGYAFALEKQMRWREPTTADSTTARSGSNSGGLDWQPWSSDAVAKARAEGRPVLVDFTAKWCLTCNVIVKPTLESTAVSAKLKSLNAVTLLADYTRRGDDISDELTRFGRAGVPLVLVYPRDAGKPAIVLPETFAQGTVLNALDDAAK